MKHKERIDEIVKSLESELKELSLNIHSNPERGNQEFKACAWQVEYLKKHGMEVEENVCDMPTAFIGRYKGSKPGPVVATISEYDCLKGIGHGCGHNLIAMIGVGTAVALKEFVDMYGGEVRVYGTPAEESTGGKIPMVKAGLFDDVAACLEVHPACHHSDSWNMSAIDGFMVEFFGKPTHAANSPEVGVNALDAMLLLFQSVALLRQQTKEDARIHGIILDGGTTVNTIPDYTRAEFATRSHRADDARELSRKIMDAAKGAALATGCEYKIDHPGDMYEDLVSNQTLTARVAQYQREMGYEPKIINGEYKSGSTDLGNVSYRCPTTQPNCKIGDAPDGTIFGMHTEYFRDFACTDEAINVSYDYIKILMAVAIDVLTEPEFVAAAKAEFDEAMKK